MASENKHLEKFKQHWQNMPIQQQFETAVGIIRNLPKDGKILNVIEPTQLLNATFDVSQIENHQL